MILYSWQQNDWPNFTYSLQNVEDDLFFFVEKIGKVTGILNALPENIHQTFTRSAGNRSIYHFRRRQRGSTSYRINLKR